VVCVGLDLWVGSGSEVDSLVGLAGGLCVVFMCYGSKRGSDWWDIGVTVFSVSFLVVGGAPVRRSGPVCPVCVWVFVLIQGCTQRHTMLRFCVYNNVNVVLVPLFACIPVWGGYWSVIGVRPVRSV
jgi:hypothetical protein